MKVLVTFFFLLQTNINYSVNFKKCCLCLIFFKKNKFKKNQALGEPLHQSGQEMQSVIKAVVIEIERPKTPIISRHNSDPAFQVVSSANFVENAPEILKTPPVPCKEELQDHSSSSSIENIVQEVIDSAETFRRVSSDDSRVSSDDLDGFVLVPSIDQEIQTDPRRRVSFKEI